MAATLLELEKRVAQLEQGVAYLRQLVEKPLLVETPAERGAHMLREARANLCRPSAYCWR